MQVYSAQPLPRAVAAPITDNAGFFVPRNPTHKRQEALAKANRRAGWNDDFAAGRTGGRRPGSGSGAQPKAAGAYTQALGPRGEVVWVAKRSPSDGGPPVVDGGRHGADEARLGAGIERTPSEEAELKRLEREYVTHMRAPCVAVPATASQLRVAHMAVHRYVLLVRRYEAARRAASMRGHATPRPPSPIARLERGADAGSDAGASATPGPAAHTARRPQSASRSGRSRQKQRVARVYRSTDGARTPATGGNGGSRSRGRAGSASRRKGGKRGGIASRPRHQDYLRHAGGWRHVDTRDDGRPVVPADFIRPLRDRHGAHSTAESGTSAHDGGRDPATV